MIWLFDTEIVNTSYVSDLESQVFQMEKALSSGSLEPTLAGEMINQVSRLLHNPPALLAPVAQRYDLANWIGAARGPSNANDAAYVISDSQAFCSQGLIS